MLKVSHRRPRIAATIKRLVAEAINTQLSDPRLVGMGITLTRIKLAPDLRSASLYFILTQETPATIERVRTALTSSASFLRHRLAEKLDLRSSPSLRFFYDERMRQEEHLMGLINKLTEVEKHEDLQ